MANAFAAQHRGIHLVFGQTGHLLVEGDAFLQHALHGFDHHGLFEQFGERAGGAPSRDAIMLELLQAADQNRFEKDRILDFFEVLVDVFQQAFGGHVLRTRFGDLHVLERAIQFLDQRLTLFAAGLQQLLQAGGLDATQHAGRRAHELALGAVDFLQFGDEHVLGRARSGHG